MKIINVRDTSDFIPYLAQWFQKKWGVPMEAYVASMEAACETTTGIPAWYYMLDDRERIIAGVGIIANEFHKRPDLTPNICALYLLNSQTLKPMTVDELRAVFCDELIMQELDDTNAYVPIPSEIIDFYKMYRPSPLVRAYCLEKKLDTPAKIYYKFEGNNTSGSHKLNSAIAQAYYAKKQGLKGATTETGAGGGSNLGGLIAPFVGEKLRNEHDYQLIAVEPASCPSFTRGVFAYDYCDTGKVCPLAHTQSNNNTASERMGKPVRSFFIKNGGNKCNKSVFVL